MTGALTPKPSVLTTDNAVTCGHQPAGRVSFPAATKLRVAGTPVITAVVAAPIGPGCTASKQGDVPCAVVVGALTTGASAKLRAGGNSVVLSSVTGSTNGVINAVPGALTVTGALPKLVAS
jgi:hypothetical protein